jgi:hypothetical protein
MKVTFEKNKLILIPQNQDEQRLNLRLFLKLEYKVGVYHHAANGAFEIDFTLWLK